MNREEWLKARMSGIGGSEMAAILGVSPWSSPADVWARKKGLIPEQADNLRFTIGRKFEGPIAEIYAEQEGVKLLKVDGLYRHPTAPLVGTPDRLIVGQKKGVEIKTADPAVAHTWGEAGTDEIPLYYTTQVATYMALLGYDDWDVAVLFGTSDFRIYRLHRDMELENTILETARKWWERYIVGNEEPAPDESNAYSNFITNKYPKNVLPMLTATEEQTEILARAFEVNVAVKEGEKKLVLLKNILKSEMGENEGLESPIGKATWKKTKDGENVDWESIALELAAMLCLPTEFAVTKRLFTKTVPGVRKFNLYPSKALVTTTEGGE